MIETLNSNTTLRVVAQHATIKNMIKSFRHKGLKKFFETGSLAGIQAKDARRLRIQLAALDTAAVIEDMGLPGFRLHPLLGTRAGIWTISVSGNWRLTFELVDGHVYILNYEDYH